MKKRNYLEVDYDENFEEAQTTQQTKPPQQQNNNII